MTFFKWFFRIIKSIVFGAVCGAGAFVGGALIFGILQLFCGWTKLLTDTLIGLFTAIGFIWGVVTMIRIGIEDDASRRMLSSFTKAYEEVTGEKYVHISKDEPQKSVPSRSAGYTHTDSYGRITGISRTDSNGAEHYTSNGVSISFQSGTDTEHYDLRGYKGSSHISEDGKMVTHYDKDNMPCGYSKRSDNGTVDHYDKWGRYTGSSKED